MLMEETEREQLAKDLKRNIRLYKENFRLMRESVGKPDHEIYVLREKELNLENIALRRKSK